MSFGPNFTASIIASNNVNKTIHGKGGGGGGGKKPKINFLDVVFTLIAFYMIYVMFSIS